MFGLYVIMDELLKYALDNGILDLDQVQKQMEENERKEILKKHVYSIWEGKNGKWYTHLYEDGVRRLIKKNTKKEVEDEVVSYWRTKIENPTIKEVFHEWNDRRLELKKISPSTHMRNEVIFKRHYTVFGEKRIKTVKEDDFEDFLERQIPEQNLTAKAFSNLKTITRGFLKRAKKRKLIDFNVEEMLQELDTSDSDFKKVVKEDYEEVFDENEMPKIMRYLIENLDMQNVALLLMFLTGIRIGEVVTLKHSDFTENSFKIRRTETRYKKDGKYIREVKEFPKTQAGVRTVVFPKDYGWLIEEIRKINPSEEYVFVKNGNIISAHSIRRRLDRICNKLYIYHKSPHKIRKTYASILLDNNIDRQFILGQMGHTDVMCTENHYHRNRRDMERKSELISSISEFRLDLVTK